jgi:hypothetical protein
MSLAHLHGLFYCLLNNLYTCYPSEFNFKDIFLVKTDQFTDNKQVKFTDLDERIRRAFQNLS